MADRAGRGPGRRTRRGARQETSAGGVVYHGESETRQFLVIRDPYGHWGLPKGHVEGEETLEQAAVREVTEETGLERLRIQESLPRIDWYFRAHGRLIHKYCHFFLMLALDDATTPRVEEGISACEWLSFGDALSRISYENTRGVLRTAGLRLGLEPADH